MRCWNQAALLGILIASAAGCSDESTVAQAPPLVTPDAGGDGAADADPHVEADADASDGAQQDGPVAADAQDGQAGCEGWSELVRLEPAELNGLMQAGDIILINVHVPYQGEIPGTDAHIAYTDVDAIEDYLGHDTCADVYLYCRTGPMSVSAGEELIARGYHRVRDLAGGMVGWQAAGFELNP